VACRSLHPRTDIRPRRADPILAASGLACLPAVRLEVLEIRTGSINFVLRSKIARRDELAGAGIAALVFHDGREGTLKPTPPARPLNSRLDPCIGLATGLAAAGRPAYPRGRRIEISIVVARQVGPIDGESRPRKLVNTIAMKPKRMGSLLASMNSSLAAGILTYKAAPRDNPLRPPAAPGKSPLVTA
jgi:hypothetical protein